MHGRFAEAWNQGDGCQAKWAEHGAGCLRRAGNGNFQEAIAIVKDVKDDIGIGNTPIHLAPLQK